MTVETPAPPPRNGFAVAWDVIVAPRAAFSALSERPSWLIAFLITCVLGMAGALLQTPAGVHVAQSQVQKMIATDPNLAGMTADKQQAVMAQAVAAQHYIWIIYPIIVLVAVAFTALILLIARAIGRGEAGFSRLFSLAMHVAIVSFGIAYLFIGVVVAFKGAANFDTQFDLISTLPSLAWLAPGAPAKVGAFLASFSVFGIWAAVLLALGVEIIAGVSRTVAIATSGLLLLLSALFATVAAR